jgi:hypothetical protein
LLLWQLPQSHSSDSPAPPPCPPPCQGRHCHIRLGRHRPQPAMYAHSVTSEASSASRALFSWIFAL